MLADGIEKLCAEDMLPLPLPERPGLRAWAVVDIMAEIYEKGQVVIPKFIRDMFGFKPGTEVGFKIDGNRVYIERSYDALAEFRKLRAEATATDEEVERAIRQNERKRNKERLHVP